MRAIPPTSRGAKDTKDPMQAFFFQSENSESKVHTAHAESNSQLQANTFAGLHVYTAQTRVPDG